MKNGRMIIYAVAASFFIAIASIFFYFSDQRQIVLLCGGVLGISASIVDSIFARRVYRSGEGPIGFRRRVFVGLLIVLVICMVFYAFFSGTAGPTVGLVALSLIFGHVAVYGAAAGGALAEELSVRFRKRAAWPGFQVLSYLAASVFYFQILFGFRMYTGSFSIGFSLS